MRPCELYLVRHAIAAERGSDWPDDTKRPLTVEGMSRFKDVVAGLDWMGVAFDEIYTSPLVRARQTADILVAHLSGKPPALKIFDELSPGRDVAAVRAELAKRVKRTRVALVGHEPALGELAALLTGAGRPLPFKKGGVCRIDLDGLASTRPGGLIWMLPPKILRKAGQS